MSKKETGTEATVKEREITLRQNTIITTIVLCLVDIIYGTCMCAYMADNFQATWSEAISGATFYLYHPSNIFPIDYDIGTPILIAFFIVLIQIMFYYTDKMKIHQNVYTIKGSSEWADPAAISDRYAEHSKKKFGQKVATDYRTQKNNIPLSKNVYVSLNANHHYRALNTMIIGTTGSGKTRYMLKPNVMQLNSSFVITDPKGDLLKECGEMLRRNGYRVRVFDTLNLKNCSTYNPLKYCTQESDIKKIVQAFMKNTDPNGGKGSKGGDPFWDNAMNAFLCATIALLTSKPKGSDIPYGQIPEVMGGMCYAPAFANLCELTRMANKKWTPASGIELLDGVALGDGKNNTANASELAAIFENLRVYEANLQGVDPEEMSKPYCLREWENFRIAPEKTSTTILMTAAVRLDPFNIEEIRNLTSTDTLDLDTFGTQRDALFLVISPTDRTYNFLPSFIYTQLFDNLYKIGAEKSVGSKILKLKNGELVKFFPKEEVQAGIKDKVKAIRNAYYEKRDGAGIETTEIEDKSGKTKKITVDDGYYEIFDADGELITRRPNLKETEQYLADLKKAKLRNGKAPKLPYHVRFLMDEFANTGEIPEFKDKLATVRGYDISCVPILQSITQLKGMYTDDYEVVDANCPFTVFLGGDENTNNEYLSKKIGKATVKGANISVGEKNKANTGYNVEQRELMMPEELGRMDYQDEIVLIYGEQPIKDKKIDYTSLPNYYQTLDYAEDVGLPHFNNFERPKTSEEKFNLIYRPIKATAIPNIFELTEDAFMRIMRANTQEEAVEKAFNSIERNSFDINTSTAVGF